MSKICYKCKKEQPDSNFHKKKSSKDGLHSYCKKCAILGAKTNYHKKTKKEKQIAFNKAKEKRDSLLEICNNIKYKYGCSFCKENNPICLDFHHLNPDKKIKAVSTIARHKSLSKMIIEINKCIVVCANCHRKIHFGLLKTNNLLPCNESLP